MNTNALFDHKLNEHTIEKTTPCPGYIEIPDSIKALWPG